MLFLTELEKLTDQFVKWSTNLDSSSKSDLQEVLKLISRAKTLLKEQLILEQKTQVLG